MKIFLNPQFRDIIDLCREMHSDAKLCTITKQIHPIMASRSPLTAEYRKNSDPFKLFGSDMPIFMCRNTQELSQLIQYNLDNET